MCRPIHSLVMLAGLAAAYAAAPAPVTLSPPAPAAATAAVAMTPVELSPPAPSDSFMAADGAAIDDLVASAHLFIV